MVFTYKKTAKSKCTTAAILLLSSIWYANFTMAGVNCLDIKDIDVGTNVEMNEEMDREIDLSAGCMASSLSSFLLQSELSQLRGQHNQLNSLRRSSMLTNNNSVASMVFPFQIDGVAGGTDSGLKHLSFYVTVDSQDGRREQTTNSLGFDFKGNNLLLGLDFQVTDSLFLGASFNVNDNKSDFDLILGQSAGSRDVDTETWAINVAKYWNSSWALQSQISFSKRDLDSVRNFSGNRFLANTRSNNEALISELVYTANVEGWRVSPSLGLTYLSAEIDGYQETIDVGIGPVASIATQDLRSLSADLSMQIDRAFLMEWGVLIPSIRISLNNEFDDDDNRVDVALDFNPATALVGDERDQSTTHFEVGVSGQFTHGLSGFVSYRQLSRHQYLTTKTFSMGVRLEF